MFCKNCGKEIAEGIKFCNNCGAEVEAQNEPVPQQTQGAAVVAVAKKSKKGLVIAITAVLACIAVVVGIVLATSGSKNDTPEKVAEKAVKAMCTGDPETLIDCCPEFALRKMASEYGLASANKKTLAAFLRTRITPDDIQNCVILNSMRNYDSSEVAEYMEDITEYGATYADIANIKDACSVTVNALVDGEAEEWYMVCIKIKDEWYILDSDD